MAQYYDPNNFGDPALRNNPDFMGHATFPSQMRNKESVFNMLRGFGGELYDISRSEQRDYQTISGANQHNTAYDINNVGAQIESVLYRQQAPAPTRPQANSPVYQGSQRPIPHPVQQWQNYNNISIDMSEDIDKYLGGSESANSGMTTTTSIDFSTALKPLEAKAEMICKILGKIYQVENDTNAVVKGLGQEIAETISASLETYATQNMNIPVPEEFTSDIDV